MDSIEVPDKVSDGAGIEKKKGRMRGFNKQIVGSYTNLKNRVSQKKYVHRLFSL